MDPEALSFAVTKLLPQGIVGRLDRCILGTQHGPSNDVGGGVNELEAGVGGRGLKPKPVLEQKLEVKGAFDLLPAVSDEAYEAAQARFERTVRSQNSARAKREYLFAGMVRCCAGHQPLSMHGKARKGHHYYACGYATNYGETAARQAHAGTKCISVREDWLERLVLRFFEQRIFGPMRLDKLAKQLRAHDRDHRRNGKLAGTRIRQQVVELERKIKAQVQALEKGIEPELVSERIVELRGEKEALEDALGGIGAERQDAEDKELTQHLARIPDLGAALREAPVAIKRQVFESFDLQIAYDKAERRVELSATVSEAVADAFENAKALETTAPGW